MTTRAGKNEQVPDKMAVAKSLVEEKDHARGVGNPAGHKPE